MNKHTNGIIIQWSSHPLTLIETLHENETTTPPMKKGRKRTLDTNITTVEIFTGIKKHCPPRYDDLPSTTDDKYINFQDISRKIDHFLFVQIFL